MPKADLSFSKKEKRGGGKAKRGKNGNEEACKNKSKRETKRKREEM